MFVEGGACATAQWHNGQSKPIMQEDPPKAAEGLEWGGQNHKWSGAEQFLM